MLWCVANFYTGFGDAPHAANRSVRYVECDHGGQLCTFDAVLIDTAAKRTQPMIYAFVLTHESFVKLFLSRLF